MFTTNNNLVIKELDWITLNGTRGDVFINKIPLIIPDINNNTTLNNLVQRTFTKSKIKVRTNSDTVSDAKTALKLKAVGIGLCRTEHMFFGPKRIKEMRKMILFTNPKMKKKAIMNLLPFQKKDFYNILKIMSGLPTTIRLLDPPLHEFLPTEPHQITSLAKELKITKTTLSQRINSLHESNPMLGHRGCRLGITSPEITEMQVSAIGLAAIKLIKEGLKPMPEIMIPLVGSLGEYLNQKKIVDNIMQSIIVSSSIKLNYKIGTMIELPRACLVADQIAEHADFISFGTNDLTQTTFGLSRDDASSFINNYIDNNIINNDPFQVLDVAGVGELIKIAIKKSKQVNNQIKIGICGEHGGNPKSIQFLASIGVDYISCSPYRIPIAYLTLAQLS